SGGVRPPCCSDGWPLAHYPCGASCVRAACSTSAPGRRRFARSPLDSTLTRYRLLSSPLIEMPFACGVVEPTIVLPASAEQWTDSRRRAVLFHELAHVKRRDLVGHTLGRVACALYWFHPLVWTAAPRRRAESERACEDSLLSC